MFDETQVTKVDALQGSIREFRSELAARKEGKPPTATYEEFIGKSRKRSTELMAHLKTKAMKTENSKEHYIEIMRDIEGVNYQLANLNTALPPDVIDEKLGSIEKEIIPLTQQTPYTLLMMRVVEIGLPLFLSLFSIFFVMRYSPHRETEP